MARAAKAAGAKPAGTNYPVITDKKMVAAVADLVAKRAQAKLIEGELDALKEQVLAGVGDVPTAYVGKHVVTVTKTPATPATENVVITAKMVGTVIPGKRGRAASVKLEVK